MSKDYESTETPVWKQLTWAEWSIIVALICIVVSFLYGWHVKAVASKAQAVASKAQTVAAEAEAKLARYDAMLKACEEVLGMPVTAPKDIQAMLDELAKKYGSASEEAKKWNADAKKWNDYANAVDQFIDAELKTYWTSPTYKRPRRPR